MTPSERRFASTSSWAALAVVGLALAGCDRLLELGDGSRSGLDTCTSAVCSLACPGGYAVDARGCETCACRAEPDAGPQCEATVCALACPYGRLTDERGCERCTCATGPDGGGDAGVDAGPVDAGGVDGGGDAGPVDAGGVDAGRDEGPVDAGPDAGACSTDCLMPCPYGYLRAPNGCDICACAPAPDAGCPGPPFCALPCQFGFKRNAQSCQICNCSPPPMPTCAPPPCTLVCSRGYNADSAGCLLCECSGP